MKLSRLSTKKAVSLSKFGNIDTIKWHSSQTSKRVGKEICIDDEIMVEFESIWKTIWDGKNTKVF